MTSQPEDDLSKEVKLMSILEKDEAVKRQLLDIYKEINRFLSEHQDETIEAELHARFPSYKTSLDKYPMELQGDERPLVVTGETSAGKSTLLNLLLGFNILPSAVLACTGVVCRIRSSEIKKAEIRDRNDEMTKTVSMGDGGEIQFKKDLSSYINPEKKHRDTHDVKYVDIYWPVPFLRKNIMVVDTPGVGESDRMTERVLEYLPNAIAMIYVIDPSRGGGLAEDRIIPLLKQQNVETAEGMKQEFDPSCALFVANKWDQIEDEDDVEKVREYLRETLDNIWPNFNSNQLHCISARKALRKKKKGKPLPEEYQNLKTAVESLIEVSLGAKSRQHVTWLQKFMTHIMLSLQCHIQGAGLTLEQKDRQMQEGEKLIKLLEENCEKSKTKLEEAAENECQRLLKEVNDHIHDEKNRDEMFPWEKSKLPKDAEDLEDIKREAYQLIQNLVGQEVNRALRKYGGVETQEKLMSKVKKETETIRKTRKNLEKLLRDPGTDDHSEDRSDCESLKDAEDSEDDTSYSTGAVAAIVVTAPIWFPLALVGGLIGVPLGMTALLIKDKFQVGKYNHNKIRYMNKWSKKYLDGYGKTEIYQTLQKSFFGGFYRQIHELFDQELPQTIAGCKKLFSNLKTESRNKKLIHNQYKPMHRECLAILGKVNDLLGQ